MGPKSPSGVRMYYQMLQKNLPKMGIQVELTKPFSCSLLWRYLNGLLQRVLFRTGLVRGSYQILLSNILYWIRVRSALKRIKELPDVIHAQDPGSASVAVRVFKKRIPVLTTCHFNEDLTDEALLQSGLFGVRAAALRCWHAWTFKHTHEWTAVSCYAAEKLRRHVPLDASIQVVYNGVDFDAASKALPIDRLRLQYAGKTLILNVGTLEPRKNQRMILDIAELLRGTSALFLLVGDGPDRRALEDEIMRRRLRGIVELLGYRNDINRIMKTVDIYCHVALHESFGLVVAEAVAAGLPVLTSATGGTPEIVGWESESCFPPDADSVIIAQRIRKLIAEPFYRADLAHRQYEHAIKNCSLNMMIHNLTHIYEELAQMHNGNRISKKIDA